ncbi:MAG: YhcH/YjgK/YiaL family protein [Endomicrobia bacterium]|nr:YhcH/YjgK/YiaL family protein [Endomicrobiia bacterium]MCL2506469.1 YhcH/YjgK/YiaL family protein [Endomicrobiia bacterium]
MIADKLAESVFYVRQFPFLKDAFDFIEKNKSGFISMQGRFEINPYIYAVIETSVPKPLNEQKLEVHRKYIDLQYIIEGCDVIGWKNLNECKEVYAGYNEEKDIMFYNDTYDFQIKLFEGSFALFFQQDAHSPLCGEFPVKKCIVKINKELLK